MPGRPEPADALSARHRRTALAIVLALLVHAFFLLPGFAQPSPPETLATPACPPATSLRQVRVNTISDRGEIALAGDTLLRPTGVAIQPHATTMAAIIRQRPLWAGRNLWLDDSPSAPDRWSRIPGWPLGESLLDGKPSQPLALIWLADGVGLADPADVPAGCRPLILRAEADARRRQLGIWREPAVWVINANAPGPDLSARIGRYQLLEGRILRISEGRQRSFVDFGARGSGAASLGIVTRQMATVLPQGVTLGALKGKRVRARGVLEWQQDRPYMTLDTAAAIEVLE
jgi:hypothetical protein